MSDLPISPHDPPTCYKCDEVIDGFRYEVRYGEWDSDTESYRSEPATRDWCQSCYNEHRKRENAAKYPINGDSGVDELLDVLESSNGTLAASLKYTSIGGGTIFVRVKDDELQSVTSQPVDRYESGNRVVLLKTVESNVTEEDLYGLFDGLKDELSFVLLYNSSETPFAADGTWKRDKNQKPIANKTPDTN